MMTSSNGNIFRVTGLLCGEFTGPGEFPAQRPVTRSFDVFFHLRLNKRLSKQPRGWWFETLSWSLGRHCNVTLDQRQTISPTFCDLTFSIHRYSCRGSGKCLSSFASFALNLFTNLKLVARSSQREWVAEFLSILSHWNSQNTRLLERLVVRDIAYNYFTFGQTYGGAGMTLRLVTKIIAHVVMAGYPNAIRNINVFFLFVYTFIPLEWHIDLSSLRQSVVETGHQRRISLTIDELTIKSDETLAALP